MNGPVPEEAGLQSRPRGRGSDLDLLTRAIADGLFDPRWSARVSPRRGTEFGQVIVAVGELPFVHIDLNQTLVEIHGLFAAESKWIRLDAQNIMNDIVAAVSDFYTRLRAWRGKVGAVELVEGQEAWEVIERGSRGEC